MVTGADGFVGHNLVNCLLKKNVEVYATIYPGNNIYSNVKNSNLHVIEVDLNRALEQIWKFPKNVDVFYHFAWIGVSPESRNDLVIQKQNIQLTLSCIELAAKIHALKFVLPGSTNEYMYYGKPIDENAVPSPENTYGAVKIALRYLATDLARQLGIPFFYVIIAGIYAADRRDNNVIYYTISKLLNREKPKLTKLEQKWDYVYIDDVVEALVAIGEKGRPSTLYCIGHGDNWKLYNYIDIIHKIIDPSLPIGVGEVPYSMDKIPSSCVDLKTLVEDTGFVPRIPFEIGIKYVIESLEKELL